MQITGEARRAFDDQFIAPGIACQDSALRHFRKFFPDRGDVEMSRVLSNPGTRVAGCLARPLCASGVQM